MGKRENEIETPNKKPLKVRIPPKRGDIKVRISKLLVEKLLSLCQCVSSPPTADDGGAGPFPLISAQNKEIYTRIVVVNLIHWRSRVLNVFWYSWSRPIGVIGSGYPVIFMIPGPYPVKDRFQDFGTGPYPVESWNRTLPGTCGIPQVPGGLSMAGELGVVYFQGSHHIYAVLVGIFAAIMGGISYCCIRAASRESSQPMSSLFSFSLLAAYVLLNS
ncbi:hypothetical protein CRG98_039283 [Punica granatum]|uniref:Uncharacterized protein n=1 Tax=Punica granatum TaxID=22663 RepID=A0A2I0I8J9_PUNGR|nr:hypothetical protein CRG98_039283 [Punica granatum]